MSTIVLAWELGGGLGHMHPLSAVGKRLIERGHQVVVVARELHRAEVPFGGLSVPIFQAPIAAPPRKTIRKALTVGETLQLCGYDCVESFGPIYRAWRVLLESTAASLVVCDYAPTAGLAARGLGVPFIAMGTGYTVPPLEVPTSHLWPWEPMPPRDKRLQREGHVLGVINRVLTRCGDPLLASLADLYDASDRFLLTFPELDHFGPRDDVRYWGTIAAGHAISEPTWPAIGGPRLFAYVSARYWGFERLIEQLAAMKLPILVHTRDLDPDRASSLATPSLRFSAQMVDIDTAVQMSTLIVSHGGHGTTSRVLMGGRPLLVLPEHNEQALVGHRLSTQGMGVDVGPRRKVAHDYAGLIRRILDDPGYAAAAQRFAERHRDYDQRETIDAIVDRCEAFLRGRRPQ